MSHSFEPVQSPPPRPSTPAWVIPLAVVGVVVVAVIGWVLLSGSPAATASPTPTSVAETSVPTDSPPPTATVPPPSPPTAAPTTTPGASPTDEIPGTPAPTPEASLSAEIQDVVQQMPALRELEPKQDVPYYVISREQFQADLLDLLAEENDPVELATQERLLKRLGLLPQGADLVELLLDLYGSQVAAFYRPDTHSFYIIERSEEFGPLDRVVVAHEYTHALQDQYYDLEGTRITDPAEGDAALAQLAVIEGDATLASFLWAGENLTLDEMLEMFNESMSPTDQQVLEDMPLVLRRQLEFPYADGFTFVMDLNTTGGWDAVNQALERPPPSTEQILHPDKYYANERPVAVSLPDVSGELGDGWQRTWEQTFGELGLQIWVAGGEEPEAPVPGLPVLLPHAEAAAGWGGDRLAMYEGPDDAWGIVWETAWDSAEEADEFVERATVVLADLQDATELASAARMDAFNEGVRLMVASDEAVLDDLVGALP